MKASIKFVNTASLAFSMLIFAGLVGCEGMNDNKSVAGSSSNAQPAAPAQKSEKPLQTAAVTHEVQPTPVQHTPAQADPPPVEPQTPVQPVAQTDSVQTSEADPELEAKRLQTQNLIYARIRIKMEELIAERAKLLKEGKDPTDPQIRQIEGQIMRARDLLQENGEVVEEVDPPIVNKAEK